MSPLLPLAHWPLADRRRIVGVMTDIDDTLTTAGAITADALDALHALRAAGLRTVAITGRPVGWSVPFAASWPVDAIVAENGAVALRREGDAVARTYLQDADTRAVHRVRLREVAARILRDVPKTTLARDSAGRETDIAIDHAEFTHLPPSHIDAVVSIMRSEGMQATVSSIHVNGWFGYHDKRVGARWIVRSLWREDLDAQCAYWAYVGDSTNDVKMFESFPHSIGVANVRDFVGRLTHLPRYVTERPRGSGFAEVARAIIDARGTLSAG